MAVIRAAHAGPSAGVFAAAEKAERPVLHRAEKAAAENASLKKADGAGEAASASPDVEAHAEEGTVRAADAGH